MSVSRQLSFGGGKVSPEFYGRVDVVRRQTGLAILKNWQIKKSGAAQNRTGTTYQATIFDPTHTVATCKWVFNQDQSYQLEFRPLGLTFWIDGLPVLETAKNIQTSITKASPCVVHCTAHGFSVGDKVYISDVGGMTELNNRYYIVRTVPGVDEFSISYSGDGIAMGTAVDSITFTTYTSGGTAERVYSVTTPYIEADLLDLKVAQSADLMIITHPDYAMRSLTRSAHTSWTLAVTANAPSTTAPTGGSATAGAAGAFVHEYAVTAFNDATGIESLSGLAHQKTITGITKANPAVVTTSAAHSYSEGDEVEIDCAGMTELDGRRFIITLPSAYTPDAALTIVSITQAAPMVVTVTGHGYSNGDTVTFSVTGMTELNAITQGTVNSVTANTFRVYYYGTTTNISSALYQAFTAGTVTRIAGNPSASTTFSLVGENSSAYGTFTSGTVSLTHINLEAAAEEATEALPNIVTLNTAAVADTHYNVYKKLGGIFGFMGSTSALTFPDTGGTPDTLESTPIYREPHYGAGNYPACCAFYQERLVTAGPDNEPNGGEGSVAGDYTNPTIHSPHKDADAVQWRTAGYQDAIRNILPLDKLVAFTDGAEFVIAGGGEGGTLTPTEQNINPRTYNGSKSLAPLLIDSNILFLDRGGNIKDFHYYLQADSGSGGYRGLNRGLFVPDLFQGHTIVSWAYQRNPDSIVWAVREDGVVLSMTYQPDQEMFAFAEHHFHEGTVENVTVVPEGEDEDENDAVYFVVARTLEDASTTRYMEKLSSRLYSDIIDATFLDSCLTYDGRNLGATTMILSGSGWTNATTLTLTASASTFTASDVGNEIQMNGLDADGEATQIRCRITAYTGVTIVTVIPHATVPVPMRAVAITDWARAVDEISGLWHLEGQTVSIFADRYVVASALNPVYETQYTVSDGAITLAGEQRYAVIHVGLPITADLKTMRLNPADNGSFFAKTKLVNAVDLEVTATRGLYVGAQEPEDDDEDPIDGLYEPKVRSDENYGEPTALKTGVISVPTRARWEVNGSAFVRQLEPLPATINAIAIEGDLFGR